ncbi:uncharacterized protein LAESUDRAFT_731971 [Laetiporus sulphureus 93-53]|uniref:Uncharacterized protein n=1 Tax=Laetiporus sulphureus 93-53 TaxID=1314785 RepID=A0A165BCG9_9APHY|nr:uncharacterized protein LAESUDRAFT_731971 [Laetiporus sulphureus 93-53]KZT00738.1 hypothetical protein LAESUDRAFT_731971 [Laetiporus sulphureus 93-53]
MYHHHSLQRPGHAWIPRSSEGMHRMYSSAPGYYDAPEMRMVYHHAQPMPQPPMMYHPQPIYPHPNRLVRPQPRPVLCYDNCCCCDACCDECCGPECCCNCYC